MPQTPSHGTSFLSPGRPHLDLVYYNLFKVFSIQIRNTKLLSFFLTKFLKQNRPALLKPVTEKKRFFFLKIINVTKCATDFLKKKCFKEVAALWLQKRIYDGFSDVFHDFEAELAGHVSLSF
jgi:hypothetical protein